MWPRVRIIFQHATAGFLAVQTTDTSNEVSCFFITNFTQGGKITLAHIQILCVGQLSDRLDTGATAPAFLPA